MECPRNVFASCWKRTGLPRFSSLEVKLKFFFGFKNFIKASVAADEEAELIHKLETLEVEEELNKEEEKEHFNDLMEAEESAGSSQAPKQPEKSEIQPKIDSFFSVKKISYLINLSKFWWEKFLFQYFSKIDTIVTGTIVRVACIIFTFSIFTEDIRQLLDFIELGKSSSFRKLSSDKNILWYQKTYPR